MTIREVRCTHRACEWPKRSARSASRCSETWTEKKGRAERRLSKLADAIDRGLTLTEEARQQVESYVVDVRAVAATLDPSEGSFDDRQASFEELREHFSQGDAVRQQMAKVMKSFRGGTFRGRGDAGDGPGQPGVGALVPSSERA